MDPSSSSSSVPGVSQPTAALCQNVNDLPDELLVYIFSCLSLQNLNTARRACKRWRSVSDGNKELLLDNLRQASNTRLYQAIDAAQANRVVSLVENWRPDPQSSLPHPFIYAMELGHVDCISALLSKVDVKRIKVSSPKGGSVLHHAVGLKGTQVLDYLVHQHRSQVKCLLEVPDEKGQSPLSFAASIGDWQSVSTFAMLEAKLEHRDKRGRTPIYLAALGGHLTAFRLLRFLGARPDATDRDGNTALQKLKQLRKPWLPAIQRIHEEAPHSHEYFKVLKPNCLVIMGGGPKAAAFSGALEVLEDKQFMDEDVLRHVAGTSAGAIASTWIAFGGDGRGMRAVIDQKDLRELLDFFPKAEKAGRSLLTQGLKAFLNPSEALSAIGSIGMLGLKKTGFCRGDAFREWLESLIRIASGEHYRKYMTFGDLRKLVEKRKTSVTGRRYKHLHVYGYNIDTRRIVHFTSADKEHDRIPITEAVRTSMSLPFLFQLTELHERNEEGARVPVRRSPLAGRYMDPGWIKNAPSDALDLDRYQIGESTGYAESSHKFNEGTLVLRLFSPEDNLPKSPMPDNLLTPLRAFFFQGLLNAEDLAHKSSSSRKHPSIWINNLGVSTWDFNLSQEQKKQLYESGKEAANGFVRTLEISSMMLRRQKHEGIVSLPSPLPDFVERQTYQESMEQKLLTDWSIQPSSDPSRVLVLKGEPATGKTELTIHFANRHLDKFSLVYRIDCLSETSRASSLLNLARRLGFASEGWGILTGRNMPSSSSDRTMDVTTITKLIWTRLENHSWGRPWMLIFDGLEEELEFPKVGGVVIVTTQSERMEASTTIEVGGFTEFEAQELVSQIIPLDPREDVKLRDVLELRTRCWESPLLMSIKCREILDKGINLKEYLQKSSPRTTKQEVLGPQQGNTSRYNQSIQQQTLRSVAQLRQAHHEQALAFLTVCVLFNPVNIPQSWAKTFLDIWNKRQTGNTESPERVIAALSRLGFIRCDDTNATFSLHGYLPRVLRQDYETGRLDAAFQDAVKLILHEASKFDLHDFAMSHEASEWVRHVCVLLEMCPSLIPKGILYDVSKVLLMTIRALRVLMGHWELEQENRNLAKCLFECIGKVLEQSQTSQRCVALSTQLLEEGYCFAFIQSFDDKTRFKQLTNCLCLVKACFKATYPKVSLAGHNNPLRRLFECEDALNGGALVESINQLSQFANNLDYCLEKKLQQALVATLGCAHRAFMTMDNGLIAAWEAAKLRRSIAQKLYDRYQDAHQLIEAQMRYAQVTSQVANDSNLKNLKPYNYAFISIKESAAAFQMAKMTYGTNHYVCFLAFFEHIIILDQIMSPNKRLKEYQKIRHSLIRNSSYHPESFMLAELCRRIADLRKKQGDYKGALRELDECLTLLRALPMKEDFFVKAIEEEVKRLEQKIIDPSFYISIYNPIRHISSYSNLRLNPTC